MIGINAERMNWLKVILVMVLLASLLGCAMKKKSQPQDVEAKKPEAVLAQAKAAINKRQYADALKIIENAIDNGVRSAELYNEKGAILLKSEVFEDAEESFEKALSLAPSDLRILHNYALSLIELNKLEEALAVYGTILEKDADNAEAYYGKGVVYYLNEDYETAIACFTQALKYRKKYNAAIYNRGLAYQKADDLEGAADDFEYCIKNKYKLAESFCGLGVIKYLQGDLDMAVQDIGKAIQLDGEKYSFFYNLGVVQVANFDYKAAIVSFTKALVFKGDFAEAYVNRGDAYMRLGAFDKGSRDLQIACNLGSCVKRDQYEALGKLVE